MTLSYQIISVNWILVVGQHDEVIPENLIHERLARDVGGNSERKNVRLNDAKGKTYRQFNIFRRSTVPSMPTMHRDTLSLWSLCLIMSFHFSTMTRNELTHVATNLSAK